MLRDDVAFHSGAPLSASDVVATVRAFADPNVASRHARVVEAIDDASAEAPLVVRFHLRRPHATLLTDLELPVLRADEASGPPRPDGSLDGLGPFRVARRGPGVVELRPAAAGALPSPARSVTIRAVHDENARALRLHAGRADVVVNGFSPTLLPALERTPGLRVESRLGATLTYLVVRTDRGALADVRVRRALFAGIDRDRAARSLFAGRATSAASLLPPVHWAHAPSTPVPFDPSEARALVESAGRSPLRLSLLTSTDRMRGTLARAVAAELGASGIELEVTPLELGTMIARLTAGDFELALLQIPELTEPNVLRVFLHSSSIPPAGSNRGRVRDAEVDRLLDEGARTRDPALRRAIYAALDARVRDEALLIPLWHEDHVVVTSARASGFLPSAEGRWLGLASLR